MKVDSYVVECHGLGCACTSHEYISFLCKGCFFGSISLDKKRQSEW